MPEERNPKTQTWEWLDYDRFLSTLDGLNDTLPFPWKIELQQALDAVEWCFANCESISIKPALGQSDFQLTYSSGMLFARGKLFARAVLVAKNAVADFVDFTDEL